MDLLIILIYTAICVVVFKVFKIPLNKWSVPTAALGGVVILGGLVFTMNYNHPYAKYAKEVFVSVPIVPQVSGTVEEVNAQPNKLVEKGALLFSLESGNQELALQRAEAAYQEAINAVLQKDEALLKATATVAKLTADRDRSKTTFERYREGQASGAYSLQQVENRQKLYEASEASLQAAEAEERRLRLVTESKVGGENTQVAQLKANRDKAQLDLDRTRVYAPTDGYALQVAIRPGVRAASLPLRPVMTFVPKEKRRIAAAFWQNSLLRLEVGLQAEVILDAVPGHVFSGKVVEIIPAMSEGEFQAVGNLFSASALTRHGYAVGIIELDENLDDYNLPLGVKGQAVAINHKHDPLHVSAMRRILLRMMAWIKFIYPVK